MKKIENRFPCFCGHSRINHSNQLTRNGVLTSCGVNGCSCQDFNADSLTWLERKYDKRTLS